MVSNGKHSAQPTFSLSQTGGWQQKGRDYSCQFLVSEGSGHGPFVLGQSIIMAGGCNEELDLVAGKSWNNLRINAAVVYTLRLGSTSSHVSASKVGPAAGYQETDIMGSVSSSNHSRRQSALLITRRQASAMEKDEGQRLGLRGLSI